MWLCARLDRLRAFFQDNGLDLALRHGDPSGFLPIPSTFIIDRAGIIRYAYASGGITDRMEPEETIALVRTVAAANVNPPGSIPDGSAHQ